VCHHLALKIASAVSASFLEDFNITSSFRHINLLLIYNNNNNNNYYYYFYPWVGVSDGGLKIMNS